MLQKYLRTWMISTGFVDLSSQISPMNMPHSKQNCPAKYPPPFLNKKYQRTIMDKGRLEHRYNRYPSFRNWENYCVQRNVATNIRRKSTRAYFQKNCTSSDSSFFKVIKQFFTNNGHKNSTDMHIQDGDQIVSSPQ